MVRDPFERDGEPDLQTVLDALDDSDCRTIIEHLDEAMTAGELSEVGDIPLSTTYRKLDLLTEASLLGEQTEIRTDGRHTTRYYLDFDEVVVMIEEDRSLAVRIERPARTPDEQLAALWTEVRRET